MEFALEIFFMKKNVFGRQFKRDANERKALFKNLLTSLVLHERIKTTQEKAKAIRGAADKLVTKAKKGGPEAYRSLAPEVNHTAIVKLINDLAPRFTARQGGYTRIIKVGRRLSDNAAMVLMEWTEKGEEMKNENGKLKKEPKVNKAEKTEAKEKKEIKAKTVKPKKGEKKEVTK